MKKLAIAAVIAIIVVGAASAQPFSGMGRGFGFTTQAQAQAVTPVKATLEGKLELVDGRVAIKKDAATYYVMIPGRLYGFVDGLKEGATVKLDGYSHEVYGVENSFVFRATKVELNGKTIDLGDPAALASGPMGMMGRGQGSMFDGRNNAGRGSRYSAPMGRMGWR